MSRLDIADYIGIPFLTHGRTREGLDCWGLVRLVYHERFGIDLPSLAEGYADATLDRSGVCSLVEAERPAWILVTPGEEQPGDVVLLRLRGLPVHVGVVTRPGWMLHVTAGVETTEERFDDGLWKLRVAGVFRHRALVRRPTAKRKNPGQEVITYVAMAAPSPGVPDTAGMISRHPPRRRSSDPLQTALTRDRRHKSSSPS